MSFSIDYIAGIFDGEGSVTINHRRRGSMGHQYNLVVCIANTDLEMLKTIKEQTGLGSIFTIPMRKNSNYQCYSYHVSNKAAYEFLKLIHPATFVKFHQIQTALKFHEECIGWLRPWNNSDKLEEKRKTYLTMCQEYKERLQTQKHVYVTRKKSL